MAALESIEAAGSALQDRLVELGALVDAFKEVCVCVRGEDAPTPSWLWTVERCVQSLDRDASLYMLEVKRHAVPVLADLKNVARASAKV